MTFTESDLAKIEQLAYLRSGSDNNSHLAEDIKAIMEFIEQLRKIDTANVAPLFHPFDLQQRLRSDEVNETDCSTQLAAIAPLFQDGFYLVPKVIESGQ